MREGMGKRRLRILVVDENQEYFDLINEHSEMFSSEIDVSCSYASTGEEALRLMGSWNPSVVLLDVHLTDMNSCTFVEQCHPEAQSIIVMSSERSREIEERSRVWGACAYMTKTNNPDEMDTVLTKIVSHALECHGEH